MKTILLLAVLLTSSLASAAPLRVFAAASLTEALSKVAEAYKAKEKIVFNFDATSKLAQQLKSGAPADLFFSADAEWMEFMEKNDLIVKGSRTGLLSNRLVLIVPSDAKSVPTKATDLTEKNFLKIALAGEAVPAGKFGRAALLHEGVDLKKLTGKIASADNVKVALKWVAMKEADAGIVYATDAKVEPKVKTAFVFEEKSHPKIVYPAAIVKQTSNSGEAKKFLDFCSSPEGKEIFRKAGFITL